MALPKFMAPRFELKVPSTQELIEYRPYLVKEEKILLIAQEGGERAEIMKAIKQIVESCIETEDFDVKKLTIFDLEYIFLKIRAKSVNNIVSFIVTDKEDGKQYGFDIDLEEVEVDLSDLPDKKIMLSDDIGIVLKYPDASLTDSLNDYKTETELRGFVVRSCIDYVFDGDEIYPWDQQSDDEKNLFLGNMPVHARKKVENFFKKIPSMKYIAKYKNSEGKEKTVVFKTLDDFFDLG